MKKLHATDMADVCASLIQGESQASIHRRFGIAPVTMQRMAAAMRSRGVDVQLRAPRFDKNREAMLHNLFDTTAFSNREIERQTGVPLSTVNKSRERYNAALVKAGGELPKCECGQYLHHPRVCWARVHQHMVRAGIASVHTLPQEQRDDVRASLLRGETMRSIAARVGLKKTAIHGYLRTFSREERQQRDLAFRTKAARRRSETVSKKIARPHATQPSIDPLYARIAAAVPRGIDPALRDDMISQAYLEVLEGRIRQDRLAEGVKKVRGRIFQAFANPWGNVSLDAALDDDRGRSMIERIPEGVSAFT